MPFIFRRQYQIKTESPAPIIPSEDSWHQPWSEPVRQKISGALAIALITSGLIAPVAVPPDMGSSTTFTTVSYKSRTQYQAYTAPVLVPSPETVTEDKWHSPWSEPVRQKTGLKVSLQQALIAPVLNPETQVSQTYESRWHYAWSEPVRQKRIITALIAFSPSAPIEPIVAPTPGPATDVSAPLILANIIFDELFQYQVKTEPVFVQAVETITLDKWYQALSEPVRQKIGLKTYLQQAAIGPVLNPETQIIQDYESRWHFAWSEPVRIKPQVPVGEQSFLIQGPAQTPEFITVDKWIYGWSEPVRQKIGLKPYLQQAYIAPVLNPETQINQDLESRWHFPWSEPVRFKRFPTAEQQSIAYQSAFFETINIDKWGFAWSEPVRQKIGLKANLQQAFIGLTLNPDTQISQDFESRWHQPWSEPVRTRRFPTAEQQAQIYASPFTPEFITVDKWVYPWSEPVRQKIGLRSNLQQALVAPVLNPETQINQDIESRWHQGWSEPVRFRRFPTAEQQSYAAPATSVFETITVDKWIYPWSEPVRQKIGLRAHLQQSLIAVTLNPETQIIQGYESRWHQPWSEPLRFRRPQLQQTYIAPVLNPNTQITQNFESRWHQPWSEPTRRNRAVVSTFVFDSPIAATLAVPIGAESSVSTVTYKTRFQYQATAQPPYFPTSVISDIKWFRPLNEPVRLKIGYRSYLQLEFTAGSFPIPLNVLLALSATETNADVASFAITVYNGISEINVSIEEILNLCGAHVSIKEIPFIDTAAASIEET